MEIKEYELPGVKTYDIKVFPDERGFFSEALRTDWVDLLADDDIAQTNISYSYPGMIRAWHRHNRGQVDYFLVLKGAMKICAYDDREDSKTKGKLVEVVASEKRLQIVKIPGHYWHGTKTVSSSPSLTIYFVNRTYDYKNPDEERRAWNDSTILDSKTGNIFDWNAPSHK
jgi:dTDP-4-dehydrorhamnose 3,5-epimerase